MDTIIMPPAEHDLDSGPKSNNETPEWRGELANRVEAYRVRRQKLPGGPLQSKLPFTETAANPRKNAVLRPGVDTTSFHATVQTTTSAQNSAIVQQAAVGLQEESESQADDFAFTIAIGRINPARQENDPRMMIDISLPTAERFHLADEPAEDPQTHTGLYPVAPMEDRRLAGAVDLACLLFACGAFLALFGSLGGHFTFSKLNAAVCTAALAVVYVQYFAMFTVFGGTTPGMMLRGLQVVSFSGEAPSSRQMLLRSLGYLVSGSAFFLGFLWSMWDQDELTWHDRISKTYLSTAETYADVEARKMAHPR